jgi:serine/threonine protein phosphatase PrpC
VSAGHHSEEASSLTVSLLRERLEPVLAHAVSAQECRASLVEAIAEANGHIARRPYGDVTTADATTVVAVAAVGGHAVGAWVGDSRVYLARGGAMTQLTVDHSWAEGVVSRGLMTAEQAAADSRAHVIIRWLGPPEDRELGIETFESRLADGDVILCCTDGLYMYFAPPSGNEDEIAYALQGGADLDTTLALLIDTALKRGGYDNITAAALRVRRPRAPSEHVTEEVPLVTAR